MPFETNVFINCPFDKDYTLLLKPLTFTLCFLDFTPVLSQTVSSGNIRVNQIKQHIRSCKYSIHDLSRSHPIRQGELPRFNIPYELGIDIGAIEYGMGRLKTKKILILEKDRYHYLKVLSDIGGQDIENHDDDALTLVTKVRNWVSTNLTGNVAGQSLIWTAFNKFNADLTVDLLAATYTQHDIDTMPIVDYMKYAKDWIIKYKNI